MPSQEPRLGAWDTHTTRKHKNTGKGKCLLSLPVTLFQWAIIIIILLFLCFFKVLSLQQINYLLFLLLKIMAVFLGGKMFSFVFVLFFVFSLNSFVVAGPPRVGVCGG